MHKAGKHGSGAHRGVTQAQADICCASSERDSSSPSTPTSVTAIAHVDLGSAIVMPVVAPAVVSNDEWRTSQPIPATPVPRHLLLSVILV